MVKIIKKFALTLIGFLITLISLELFFRMLPGNALSYSIKAYQTHSPMEEVLNKCYPMFRPSAILGYEHIPKAPSFIPNSPFFNYYGMVGREHKLKKDERVYRIIVLGDSIAEQNLHITLLEDWLNNNFYPRYKFEFWNAGVSGYQISQYAKYLKYKGIKYDPDMVIIFFCLNDFSTCSAVYYKNKDGFLEYYFPAPEVAKHFPPIPFLFRQSHLYRFLLIRLESNLRQSKNRNNLTSEFGNGMHYLSLIKDICLKRGISLLAVIFPYLKPESKY